MEITKLHHVQTKTQYSNKTITEISSPNEQAKIASNSEVVTLSPEALEMQNKEIAMTPLFGGGTTLPPWPPKPKDRK